MAIRCKPRADPAEHLRKETPLSLARGGAELCPFQRDQAAGLSLRPLFHFSSDNPDEGGKMIVVNLGLGAFRQSLGNRQQVCCE